MDHLLYGKIRNDIAGLLQKKGENSPVGLILCAEKGTAEAHYALNNLPN